MLRYDTPIAGIFCKDMRLSRLLEIQLGICGVTQVFQLWEFPENAEQCLMWLVDLDVFPYEELPPRPDGCRLYGFTQSIETQLSCPADITVCFHRPFAMTALEAVICQDLYGDDTDVPVVVSVATPKIQTPQPMREALTIVKSGIVAIGEREIPLTKQEWVLFECLWRHRGQVVPKEVLRKALNTAPQSTNTLEVYICFLRRKLEKISRRKYITTVRGEGYRLNDIS